MNNLRSEEFRTWRRARWILAVAAFTAAGVQAQNPVEDDLYGHVLLLEGKTSAERGTYIETTLRKSGVGYMTTPFRKVFINRGDTVRIAGNNIVARIGRGSKRVVVGAHFDVSTDSPGANDNGSGTAVALELVRRLSRLDWNCSIDVCFFDQEEAGNVGSTQYIRQFVIPSQYVIMINVDVVGMGDELYVGPTTGSGSSVLALFRDAAQELGVRMVEGREYPSSDHESFTKARLQSISMSVVPAGDGQRLSTYLRNSGAVDSSSVPRLLSVIHTPDDRSIYVQPASLKLAFEVMSIVLRRLNEQL